MARHHFPDGFIWGVATSAQQIEGGRDEGGRGESIWDRFAATPGKISDGSDTETACDHYHRWREDVALMRGLGLGGYRFSIAWPRIQPEGVGPANVAGLDFYDALVDGLLEAGLTPFPTLYHWDLPQALQDRGGWAERETVDRFVDYARLVVARLGDRVPAWTTHNEPWCIATLGHEEGHHAPGHLAPPEGLRVAHHLLLSHGRACAAIRAESPAAEVGLVHNYCHAYPAADTDAARDAARWFDGFFNRWYLDPLHGRGYPEDAVRDRVNAGHLSLETGRPPFVADGDLEEIAAPTDFLGVNYYSPVRMDVSEDGRPVAVPAAPADRLTDMGWEVYPDGLYEGLMRVARDYAPDKILIAENGAAYDDPVDADGRIRDTRRIDYLRGHLSAIHRAIADGAPVAGYYQWSLLDNFEWGFGYTKRFGLYAVEPETLNRLPKDSAAWYRDVATANAVDAAAPSPSQGDSRVELT